MPKKRKIRELKFLNISSRPPEKCSNKLSKSFLTHIKPGDFYIIDQKKAYCLGCYQGDIESIIEEIKNSQDRDIKKLRRERQIELMEWEKWQIEILNLVAYNMRRAEFDEKVEKIKNICSRDYNERYLELKQQLNKESTYYAEST